MTYRYICSKTSHPFVTHMYYGMVQHGERPFRITGGCGELAYPVCLKRNDFHLWHWLIGLPSDPAPVVFTPQKEIPCMSWSF